MVVKTIAGDFTEQDYRELQRQYDDYKHAQGEKPIIRSPYGSELIPQFAFYLLEYLSGCFGEK